MTRNLALTVLFYLPVKLKRFYQHFVLQALGFLVFKSHAVSLFEEEASVDSCSMSTSLVVFPCSTLSLFGCSSYSYPALCSYLRIFSTIAHSSGVYCKSRLRILTIELRSHGKIDCLFIGQHSSCRIFDLISFLLDTELDSPFVVSQSNVEQTLSAIFCMLKACVREDFWSSHVAFALCSHFVVFFLGIELVVDPCIELDLYPSIELVLYPSIELVLYPSIELVLYPSISLGQQAR